MEILRHLADTPSHGYGLHKEVGVSTPVVYRHLRDLEDAGMVEAVPVEDDNRDKTEYHLTERGQKLLTILDQ